MVELKELTYEAVNNAAKLLIEASPEGTTTSLHVKNLLRYLKYEAKQADVSAFLDEMYNKEDGFQRDMHYKNGFSGQSFYVYYWEEPVIEDEDDFTYFDFSTSLV